MNVNSGLFLFVPVLHTLSDALITHPNLVCNECYLERETHFEVVLIRLDDGAVKD